MTDNTTKKKRTPSKFESWGLRIRETKELNYFSAWIDLITTRFDLGETMELPCRNSEFYDVAINTTCNACCPMCYVSATQNGDCYTDICETWKKYIATLPKDVKLTVDDMKANENIDELLTIRKPSDEVDLYVSQFKFLVYMLSRDPQFQVVMTHKPFQIAIGSTGEPTIHPDFCKFLECVYNTNVVPNYTTNGIAIANDDELSKKILEATSKYVGGVAVSYGNKALRDKADKAIAKLIDKGNCKVMIHHIISDNNSVDEFVEVVKKYGSAIHYHVLLPLMKHGRSTEEMSEETFLYMCEQIKKHELEGHIAVGANFLPYLEKHSESLRVWEYPRETYSKNMILKNGEIVITSSSYNLTPIETIQ